MAETEPESWRRKGERGSALGIRFTVWMATLLGRRLTRLLVRVIAFYFTLFAPSVRRSLRSFLRRVGEPTGFARVYAQVLRFAHATLDAVYFLRGDHHHFRITRNGHEHLEHLRATRTGAILLGAHFGSFYAMRAQSAEESLPLYPLVYTKNARRINDVLEALAPESKTRLVEIEDGNVGFMLRVRELLDAGNLVAILGDRVADKGPQVEVDFLGSRVSLPAGPYLLAATLKCPVYFTAGVYHAPSHYELFCEPFAERVVLPRQRRKEALEEYAQRYADHLAAHVRRAPDNWFNFYDYFGDA